MGATAQVGRGQQWAGDYWHHLNNDYQGDEWQKKAAEAKGLPADNHHHQEITSHPNGFTNS